MSSRVPYRDVPPGFFERLLVLCREDYSHMDFSDTAAAFYGSGLKAQLFLSVHPNLDAFVSLRFTDWRADYVSAGMALRWGKSERECDTCPKWDL